MQAVSAKSYDHVVSNSVMTTPSTSRNVNFTGIYPLYNKPADVKGARVVATAATLDRLANANVSTDNVRAYRVAETNSGSALMVGSPPIRLSPAKTCQLFNKDQRIKSLILGRPMMARP
ncbi:hypothetical protein [Lentilactobacillus buchneri]|uniref:hypothetical protein n=1 Tax=Lentilactobacillus buchneri TaxID=1581 RepID=UPI0038733AB6